MDAVERLQLNVHIQKHIAAGEGIRIPEIDLRCIFARQKGFGGKGGKFGQAAAFLIRDFGTEKGEKAKHAKREKGYGEKHNAEPLAKNFQLHRLSFPP